MKLVLCELWKGSIDNKKGAVRKVFSSTTSASPPFEGSPRTGAAEYVLRGDVNTHFVKLSKFDKVNCSDNQSLLFTL